MCVFLLSSVKVWGAHRPQLVVITPEDYVLGMSDLTGELMRYATNGES